MSITRFFKQFLRRRGLVVARSTNVAVRYLEAEPNTQLDLVLLQAFPRSDGLRFIQIGANDGRRGDPVWHKVHAHGWTGLLVEPMPSVFAELRRNYAGWGGLTFLNAAVDVAAGTRPIYFLRPGLTVPDWAHGLPTFDRARLERTAAELGLAADAIEQAEIRAVTWDQVLADFGAGPCDVLVVDAEAYDIPILRAAPLRQLRPKVIHFEHSCATLPDRLGFYGELIELGYELATDGPDTTAWLRPAARP
jgi:FkbM family methyltransferase